MPRISREEIGDQAAHAASRWRALQNSTSAAERANAGGEAMLSRFWQAIAADPDNDQSHFEDTISEWKLYCDTHKDDPVPPNFLHFESQVRSIETMLSLDVSSYDHLAEKIEADQIKSETENQKREREQLAAVHRPTAIEDAKDADQEKMKQEIKSEVKEELKAEQAVPISTPAPSDDHSKVKSPADEDTKDFPDTSVKSDFKGAKGSHHGKK